MKKQAFRKYNGITSLSSIPCLASCLSAFMQRFYKSFGFEFIGNGFYEVSVEKRLHIEWSLYDNDWICSLPPL